MTLQLLKNAAKVSGAYEGQRAYEDYLSGQISSCIGMLQYCNNTGIPKQTGLFFGVQVTVQRECVQAHSYCALLR